VQWTIPVEAICCAACSASPELLEPRRREFGIAHGVLNVAVSKVRLQGASVVPFVYQSIAQACLRMCGCALKPSLASVPARSTMRAKPAPVRRRTSHQTLQVRRSRIARSVCRKVCPFLSAQRLRPTTDRSSLPAPQYCLRLIHETFGGDTGSQHCARRASRVMSLHRYVLIFFLPIRGCTPAGGVRSRPPPCKSIVVDLIGWLSKLARKLMSSPPAWRGMVTFRRSSDRA